jgi:ABC-type Fe3+/spermidine/putrescine transport system ATPase subunit
VTDGTRRASNGRSSPATPPEEMDSAYTCVKGVGRTHKGSAALNAVSFTMIRNERHALLGPSRCGQSTSLSIIAGLDDGSNGTLSVPGETASRDRLRHCAATRQGGCQPHRRWWAEGELWPCAA